MALVLPCLCDIWNLSRQRTSSTINLNLNFQWLMQNLILKIKGNWISFGWNFHHIQDSLYFLRWSLCLGRKICMVDIGCMCIGGGGDFHSWLLLPESSPTRMWSLVLVKSIVAWWVEDSVWVLNMIWSDATDFCCYSGLGKDHVHFLCFQRIFSLSLFRFCQHQEGGLKPITWLRDFSLWLFSLRSTRAW